MKIACRVLIATGVAALLGAILFAFSVGGPVVPVLLVLSVLLNSVGITLLREKK